MAVTLADLTQETSVSEGTGALALSGPRAGYQAFENGDVYYAIRHETADEWEVGFGTVSGGDTLARTTVLSSSNSDSAVSFSGGGKVVALVIPASKMVFRESNGDWNSDAPGMTGDSGSGGKKGLVPAPGAGDSGKVLSGAGTWIASSGDVVGPASATADAIALFNGTGGKTIKDSTYTITAAGAALLDDASAAAQRTTLSAAASGANSDITSITGLTTDLTVAQGGTGASTLTGILKGNGTSAFSAAIAGTDYATKTGSTAPTEHLSIAVSDETTALTTGTAKATFRVPYAFTLTAVRSSVTTAPTGATLTVDINEGGTTILSTKLTIDVSEKTSTTAATAAVISDSALADDAEITIDIDQVGSSTAGAGLKVYLIGYKT